MTNSSTNRRGLLAGTARVVITPPVGIRMLGYTVQEGCSQSIERELTATALVLSDGRTKAVIIACDIVFIQTPHVDRIRERIAERLGISYDNILINASHTHLGPMLPGWKIEPSDQHQLQARYVATLEESLAGLASMANANLKPARFGAGRGEVSIGINRREKLPNGRVIIGENPQGAVDRELSVLRIDDLSGLPIATLMAAGCHTVVLGPKTLALSPDFIGPARQIVESATGTHSLFLQGAAGNINPVCGIGTGGSEQFDDSNRIGAMLAGETLKTWAAIRTHNRSGERRVVQSVAAISTWDYEPVPVETIEFLGVKRRQLTLSLAHFPDREFVERQLAEKRKARDEAEARGDSQGIRNVTQRLYEWADLVARTQAEGKPVTRDLEVWAMRINDVGIVAVNGEPFAELSLEVKSRSPLPNTIFLGYSNGCLGYFPTPEAFGEGGMEVEESVQNYMLPSRMTPEWGPTIVRTALELLQELAQQ